MPGSWRVRSSEITLWHLADPWLQPLLRTGRSAPLAARRRSDLGIEMPRSPGHKCSALRPGAGQYDLPLLALAEGAGVGAGAVAVGEAAPPFPATGATNQTPPTP